MDRIFIENLRVGCLIGVTEDERRLRQKVVVDVGLERDLGRAAATGKVGDTADYRKVKDRISRVANGREFVLLETLAEEIASVILDGFDVEAVVVRVRKEKYSDSPSIGVEVRRARGRRPR